MKTLAQNLKTMYTQIMKTKVTIYHGSSVPNLTILTPRQSMHDKPYIYFSTNIVVAALYTANPLKSPHYWYPYGFDKDGRVKYSEVYPDALKDFYGGKKGYIYECIVDKSLLENLPQIPSAKLSTVPVKVHKCIKINDAYKQFLQYIKDDKFVLTEYKKMTEKGIQWYHNSIIDSLNEHGENNSYSDFIKLKMPIVWEEYLSRKLN